MLRFKALTITNFGPYYGTHTINFPDEDGVVFVWAMNGTGKTSLLNAIRFVLFGSLKDSKFAKRPLNNFINAYAVDEGNGMSVRIDCSIDGESGYIIRRLERNGVGDGSKWEDYSLTTSINWQSQVLSQEQVRAKLETLLPSNIARFYLFDAELLDQYSKLVEDDVNNDNALLKKSIEGILGLPILEGARFSISQVQDTLSEAWQTESKKKDRFQKKGEVLKMQSQKKGQLEEDLSNQQHDLEEKIAERDDCQLKLEENSNFRSVLEREEIFRDKINSLEEFVISRESELKDALDNLWGIIFNASITQVISSKEAEIKRLESEHIQEEGDRILSTVLEQIVSNNLDSCPACHGDIDASKLAEIKVRLQEISSTDLPYKKEINILRGDISAFNLFKNHHSFDEIERAISNYEEAYTKLQAAKVELNDILTQKSSFHSELSAGDLKMIAEDLAKVLKEIEILKEGIAKSESELKDTKEQIEKIKSSLSNTGDIDLDAISAKQDFADKLYSIFDLAIARFRDNLKNKVEKSASEFFSGISHDEDYTNLRINDNYGLEIINEDGRVVPNRSEGFEQVVAVSLIAALHNNTPIMGPIVMDSTFQRIDSVHKENTLKSLPSFGKQIIVLCYPSEVDGGIAKRLVGNSYLKDYYVHKISSLKSTISDDPNKDN